MELKEIVIHAILEKKAMAVKAYDCMDITPFVDTMIVASTNNIRQNNAIAQNVKDRIKEAGLRVDFRMEGKADSKWLLVDLGSIVVHLFVKEERQVYQLDRLYADCPVEEYDI